MNWSDVVSTDRNLEAVADKSSEQLAKHRWHWTLDESNPERVNINEYAHRASRNESAIREMANGYAAFVLRTLSGEPVKLADEIARSHMGAETAAAAQAVANARGISLSSAQRGTRTHETRQVRETARQLAEERGTSVEEEAPRVAEAIVKSERADAATAATRASHADARFFDVEHCLLAAKRELSRAVKLAHAVEWDDEHRELLAEGSADVRSRLGLLDAAIYGDSGTDWDAEFAKIGQEQ